VRTHLLVGCLRTFPIPLKFPDFTEKKRVLTSNVMQHHVMMPNYHKYINLICSHNFLVFPLSPLCGLSSDPSLLLWLFCLNTKYKMQHYRCSMLSTDFSTSCALNFIQYTDILITLRKTSAKNNGLERKNRLQ